MTTLKLIKVLGPPLPKGTIFKFMRAFCRTMQKTKWDHNGTQIRAFVPHLNSTVDYCPVTWVAYCATGEYHLAREYRNAGNAINMPMALCKRVVNAADDGKSDPQMRRILDRAAKPL